LARPAYFDSCLFANDVRRLVGQPVEQVPRFPEAPVVRAGAEHHDRDLVIALRQAQQRRQAVAGLGDEAGLAAEDVHFPAATRWLVLRMLIVATARARRVAAVRMIGASCRSRRRTK
jgi:hypothetical protein